MPDLRARARAALAARLRELVPAAALHRDGAHALRLEDTLVPTLSADDVAWARAALAARAKGELRPTRAGAVPVHAAWSSTALVCSALAPWRTRPDALALAPGTGPFTDVRLEERLLIPHGGGTPNLDVALATPAGLVGVESKLTEHLTAAAPRRWPPAYHRPAMAAALRGGWAALFADLRDGRWAPRHVDAGQLVRHALSLRGEHDLVLVWWEPANADDHPEVRAHRAEVAEVLARVAGAAPRLHALPWARVLDAWEAAAPAHVAALRARYDVAVESS
jgi:hypothetical protein